MVEEASVFSEILIVCRDILKTFSREELDQKGARIVTNIGKFQDTPHLHVHVVIGMLGGVIIIFCRLDKRLNS